MIGLAAVHPPLPEGGLIVSPYVGTIDITDLVNSNTCDDDCERNILNRLALFSFWGNSGYTIGVAGGLNIGLEQLFPDYRTFLTGDIVPIAVVSQERPLTSVTHEFYHQLNYYHAGLSCPPGWPTISWPPDDRAGRAHVCYWQTRIYGNLCFCPWTKKNSI